MDDLDIPSMTYLNIAGSGDASILRSLVQAGLLKRDPPKTDCSNQYQWLLATPEGLVRLESESDRVATIRARLKQEEHDRNQRYLAENSENEKVWITERHWSL